jgi:ribosomal protein S18 acetylase RimI-like enzyme
MSVTAPVSIRRSLRADDIGAIVALHDRVYRGEYDRNDAFLAAVAGAMERAVAAGWPSIRGAVWLVEVEGRVEGSLALTDEGDGVGQVRWVVLAPELRGRGRMRSLVAELVAEARAQGLTRLELDTYSELTSAARIYRSVGFRVVAERRREDWGPAITYQHYVLDLT